VIAIYSWQLQAWHLSLGLAVAADFWRLCPAAEFDPKIFHGLRELSGLAAWGPSVASPSKLATVEWVSRAM